MDHSKAATVGIRQRQFALALSKERRGGGRTGYASGYEKQHSWIISRPSVFSFCDRSRSYISTDILLAELCVTKYVCDSIHSDICWDEKSSSVNFETESKGMTRSRERTLFVVLYTDTSSAKLPLRNPIRAMDQRVSVSISRFARHDFDRRAQRALLRSHVRLDPGHRWTNTYARERGSDNQAHHLR